MYYKELVNIQPQKREIDKKMRYQFALPVSKSDIRF